jgi:hypothetical protein
MNKKLEAKRKRTVEKMLAIRSLRRGTLNEQYVDRTRDGKPSGEVRGPYYVLSRRERGKTVSIRVSKEEVEQVRADLDRYDVFVSLCEEFIETTERLAQAQREQGAAAEALKKSPKSKPSNRKR